MSLSKKIRFEVFKRDGFKCQYCGSHPPEKILEVDHIHPISKGGTDEINNLITSCFECNRGKSNNELSKIPTSLSIHIDILTEKEEQYKSYRKLLRSIERRVNNEIDEVQNIYKESFPNLRFTDGFRKGSVKNFISKLDLETVKDSMALAVSKGKDSHNTIKYFCGICWNKINNNGKRF